MIHVNEAAPEVLRLSYQGHKFSFENRTKLYTTQKGMIITMKEVRFDEFALNIYLLQKSIRFLEAAVAEQLGIKSVHTFWIYSLLNNPEGMTAAEIASKHNINRSLVSREIDELHEKKIVEFHKSKPSSCNYNAKIRLTEKGKKFAESIKSVAMEVQNCTSSDISVENLEIFYSVLERLSGNLNRIAIEKTKKRGNIE